VNLTKRDAPGAAIVDITGKFVGGPDNSDKFHSFFKTLLSDGHKKVVVNLGKTPWANSQGIGMLISAHTSIAKAGGELVLANVTDRIQDILTVTRLLLIFKTFKNEAEALEYLASQG
jgi:anti-sigma B factor antagonist